MGKAPNITMAKGTKKATRKFEKNHLKDTLEKRKAGAKIKQRNQVKAKRQARNAKDAEFEGKGGEEESKGKAPVKEDPFGKMNVDDFFQGRFEKSLLRNRNRKQFPRNWARGNGRNQKWRT